MHRSNYRPNRSQQLILAEMVAKKYGIGLCETIIVHHVLEDSPTNLYLQIERHVPGSHFKFERVYL